MFQPFRLRDMVLPNRVVVSPMDMYSAVDGVPQDWHLVHYGARAIGGAGADVHRDDLRLAGGPHHARLHRPLERRAGAGLGEDRRLRARELGREVLPPARPLGPQGRDEADVGGHGPAARRGRLGRVLGLAVPYFPDSAVPRELDRADMDRIVAEFVAAAERGERAGFDMLELHCAHGYLLASFISPLTNRRSDEYGGTLENRLRFPLEVFTAMREAWPAHKPMSVRISATDWAEGGLTGDDAVAVARAFAAAGVDLVDVSTGQTVAEARPIYGRMFQTPFADQIRNEAHVATMCVGAITTPDQVNTILAAGRADLVALGAPAPRRPVLHHEGGGLVRRAGDLLPAAVPAGEGPDLPQLGPRPRRPRGSAHPRQAEDARRAQGRAGGGAEVGGGVRRSQWSVVSGQS